MLNQEAIRQALCRPMSRTQVDQLAVMILEADFPWKNIIDLSFDPEPQVGFRAAWLLEALVLQQPEAFKPLLPYFISRFPAQENSSARRHFAKIAACLLTEKKDHSTNTFFKSLNLDALVNALFNWLIDDGVAVAVKVHCMQALANLTCKYPWIREELLETLRHFSASESKGYFSRFKQIEKVLAK